MTEAQPRTPRVVRFGEFSFDPNSGELVGPSGVARLQPHVASLLAVLVEHGGAVVSRGELQQQLWPDTTVDFEDGLNYCVRQLRLALGDDAASPRYVETLPKRGYRFIQPVLRDEPASDVSSLVQAGSRRTGVNRRVVTGAAVVAVLGAYAIWSVRRVPAPAANSVVVLPFAGDTSDAMMVAYQRRLNDAILRNAGLERSLQLVTDSLKATYVLSGSLKRQGSSVRIFVELVLAHGRRHLWADDMLDSYAFSGNSTLTADRIEKNLVRVLQDTLSQR